MTTARQKFQQTAIGILVMLSLSVWSVAACMCSHHSQAKQTEKRSCHGGPTKQHHDNDSNDTKHSYFSENCICAPPTTNLSVKSEGFKLKKQPAAPAETSVVQQAGFYSPTPDIKVVGTESVSVRRSDRPPASRGPPRS